MKCPVCTSENSAVIRSGVVDETVRRTRQCGVCGKRWVTIEAPAEVLEAATTLRAKLRDLVQAIGPLPGEG